MLASPEVGRGNCLPYVLYSATVAFLRVRRINIEMKWNEKTGNSNPILQQTVVKNCNVYWDLLDNTKQNCKFIRISQTCAKK